MCQATRAIWHFKKGNKSVMSNYQLIIVTSLIVKMLESIIFKKIQRHLEPHELITDSQRGFTKGNSCFSNLLSFYRTVYEAADKGLNYDVIYLDFTKQITAVDIGKSNSEKSLGVLVSQDLRPREQCISARNKDNRVLDFITRNVSNRSADVILRLYLALVRPHSDYDVLVSVL